MSGSTFGKLFQLHTFGESHGAAIGGIIEGCPAGLEIDLSFIQAELNKRKPGQSQYTTQRSEDDKVEFLSGIFEGRTTGTPIGFMIANKDARSKDYSHLKDSYRPSHADYVYEAKYGLRDYRGGGRSSARETACRIVGGAIAQLLLQKEGVQIFAYVQQLGSIQLLKELNELELSSIYQSEVRCPDEEVESKMKELILQTAKEGDTLGGAVQTLVKGVPAGWGEPVFDKLHADLGKAMLSINAVKGFEYGSGFCASEMKGSQHNDPFEFKEGKISTKSNFSGGIQGGISNGEDIYFRTAFKPVATIMKDQESVDKDGNPITIKGKGRHDVTVLPRAVPIVSAMTALVLADHMLRARVNRV